MQISPTLLSKTPPSSLPPRCNTPRRAFFLQINWRNSAPTTEELVFSPKTPASKTHGPVLLNKLVQECVVSMLLSCIKWNASIIFQTRLLSDFNENRQVYHWFLVEYLKAAIIFPVTRTHAPCTIFVIRNEQFLIDNSGLHMNIWTPCQEYWIHCL